MVVYRIPETVAGRKRKRNRPKSLRIDSQDVDERRIDSLSLSIVIRQRVQAA